MADTRATTPYVPPMLAEVPRERWPTHIAIIMDGNGRWARRRGLQRLQGHQQGGKAARQVVEEAARLGIPRLTLYAFSHENWRRPREEVSRLLTLYEQSLKDERKTVMKHNVRFVNIGRRENLPTGVLREVAKTQQMSAANTGMTLCVAVNYGGRQEIVDAARRLADDVARGELDPADIDESRFASRLYTAGSPDPDLLIRTAGEMRVSNFLLWQISYAEIHVTNVLWPDFSKEDLHRAIADFAGRHRRFGGLDSPQGGEKP